MRGTLSRPTVFVASSSEGLTLARDVRRGLARVADVVMWETAFDPGTWLLGGILSQAQKSDFGIFIIQPDDTVKIRGSNYTTVRDNVLFEAGIFMGALGAERTFLLWPSGTRNLRLPSDLAGLLRETYTPAPTGRTVNLSAPLRAMRQRIERMGPALRSGYNEIMVLKQALYERDIEADGEIESLRDIVASAARSRSRPWFAATSVEALTDALRKKYEDDIVDTVFWWLVVQGVITFDDIDLWSSDGSWWFEDSVEFTVFTERGLALLNELRAVG